MAAQKHKTLWYCDIYDLLDSLPRQPLSAALRHINSVTSAGKNSAQILVSIYMSPHAADIEQLFNDLFGPRYRTRLVGGADEPEYFPAGESAAEIHYRADYVRSALHEIAHWCIAGDYRRRLHDYGYWYSPDGRNAEQQQAFYRVEVAPQALEWIFSLAANVEFAPSLDNLGAGNLMEDPAATSFGADLQQRVQWYLQGNLNSRALAWVAALLQLPTADKVKLYAELAHRWGHQQL